MEITSWLLEVSISEAENQEAQEGQGIKDPTNIFACCRVGLPAAGGGIVAAGVAT